VTDSLPRLRELLGEAGSRLGMERAAETGALWRRWEEVVGPTIAAHAEPTSLRRGVLKIRTDSPTWATELGYLSEQVMSAANELLGGQIVSEVQVWTAPGPIRKRAPATSGSERARGRGAAPARPAPEDPEEAFERAREAWARRRSRSRSGDVSKASPKPEKPW
jgi:predicted nucleic acid-binding Zn ribbon protein